MAEDHHHPLPTSPVEDRVAALEALLVDKGIIKSTDVDNMADVFENSVGPMNGARVVARCLG